MAVFGTQAVDEVGADGEVEPGIAFGHQGGGGGAGGQAIHWILDGGFEGDDLLVGQGVELGVGEGGKHGHGIDPFRTSRLLKYPTRTASLLP